MMVTITEQFTSDPSNRERSPTIIWKPDFRLTAGNFGKRVWSRFPIKRTPLISLTLH